MINKVILGDFTIFRRENITIIVINRENFTINQIVMIIFGESTFLWESSILLIWEQRHMVRNIQTPEVAIDEIG